MNASELRMDQRVRRSRRELVREAFVTGLAVVVPLLVTAIAFQFVHDALSLFARAAIVAGDGTNGDDGESPAHKSTERGSLC